MIPTRWAPALFALTLAACAAPEPGATPPAAAGAVPEQVVAMAAPYQFVQSARLMDDGCYWYSHAGPVETTLLPLKTVDGRPICLARETAPTG